MQIPEVLRTLPLPARLTGGLVAALLTIALVWFLGSIVAWTVDVRSETGQLKPRIARLKGYIEHQDRLEAAARSIEDRLDKAAYPASVDINQTGAELQQELRRFAEQAALTVQGSQLVQRDEDEDSAFDRVAVQLDMTGDPEAIDGFLLAVAEHEPLLAVELLQVSAPPQRRRSRRGEPEPESSILTVSARVAALRSRP